MFDGILEEQAQKHDRHRTDDDQPAQPGISLVIFAKAEVLPQPGSCNPHDIGPEIDQHRHFRADLGNCGEGGPGIRAGGQELPGNPQMRA
ncbi:hypothetical protein D3C86_1661880 [compost metagenome]